jgi:hypothetical protein
MSDRITWEECPSCGGLAAIGWRLVLGSTGAPIAERAVEFDCPNGCEAPPFVGDTGMLFVREWE